MAVRSSWSGRRAVLSTRRRLSRRCHAARTRRHGGATCRRPSAWRRPPSIRVAFVRAATQRGAQGRRHAQGRRRCGPLTTARGTGFSLADLGRKAGALTRAARQRLAEGGSRADTTRLQHPHKNDEHHALIPQLVVRIAYHRSIVMVRTPESVCGLHSSDRMWGRRTSWHARCLRKNVAAYELRLLGVRL